MGTKCVSMKNTAFASPSVPMDVTESGDDFLAAGGPSQSDAHHRMRSPDSMDS